MQVQNVDPASVAHLFAVLLLDALLQKTFLRLDLSLLVNLSQHARWEVCCYSWETLLIIWEYSQRAACFLGCLA